MAITYGILYEDDTGLLSHSRYSSLLATNASFANWARFMTNYSLPTALKFPEATKQWGETTAKNQTAFQLAQGIDVPFFDHLRADAKMNSRSPLIVSRRCNSQLMPSQQCFRAICATWPRLKA